MEKKYSLPERLFSDTPAFFKRAQAFGTALTVLAGALAKASVFPDSYSAVMASIGITITAISQFAVKQCEPLNQESHNEIK